LPDDIIAAAQSVEKVQIGKEMYVTVPLALRGEFVGAAYLEPVGVMRAIERRSFIIVFGLCTAFAALAVMLFGRTATLVARRVRQLDDAMDRIGAHDLSHRVPVGKPDDELTHIAVSFNRMCEELEENIERLYINEIKKKSAELDALQASINPHFLFNSLQAACGKARKNGDKEVADFLVLLSSLLRGIVRSNTIITIRKEVEFCSIYVELFRLRYGEGFECEFDVDSAVAAVGIPKNVLQPIIENYFVHGIRQDDEDNRVTVRAGCAGAGVRIEFEDNGQGIDPALLPEINSRLQKLETPGRGMGLINVSRRLRLVFGEDYSLSLAARKPRGVRISLEMPRLSVADLTARINPSNRAAIGEAEAEPGQI
jgi:two-component system sensor histidine kinase YesM